MNTRISIWDPKPGMSSDDAGTTVLQYSYPPLNAPAPYESRSTHISQQTVRYVPTLQSLCVKKLACCPEQVHNLGPVRLLYEPPKTSQDHDIIRELIPEFFHSRGAEDHYKPDKFLKTVDPRLWAVLVQVYTNLPELFTTYSLPLADAHLPILQQIPATSHFALVTVVDLHGCADLNDRTIVRLRELHSLAALDISGTAVTSWGIKSFSKTMTINPSYPNSDSRHLEGPWRLRILSLRDCIDVQDDAFDSLSKFPLLSVIDLRGTRCTSSSYASTSFRPSNIKLLFHPESLLRSLDALSLAAAGQENSSHSPSIFPHPKPSYLHIASQYYQPPPKDARHGLPHARRRPGEPSSSDMRFIAGEELSWERPSDGHEEYLPSSLCERPYDPSDSDEPNEPYDSGERDTSLDVARNLQNLIATYEARRQTSKASAAAFYAQPSRGPNQMSSDPRKHSLPSRMANLPKNGPTGRRKEDHDHVLTLYRPPPPWQTLEKLSIASEVHTRKRARTASDEPLPLITPKRKEKAKAIVRRGPAVMITSEFERDKQERKKAPLSTNPFLRNAPQMLEEAKKTLAALHASISPPSTSSASKSRAPRKTPASSRTSASKASTSSKRSASSKASTSSSASTVSASKSRGKRKAALLDFDEPQSVPMPSTLRMSPLGRDPGPLRPVTSWPIPQLPESVLAEMRRQNQKAIAEENAKFKAKESARQTRLFESESEPKKRQRSPSVFGGNIRFSPPAPLQFEPVANLKKARKDAADHRKSVAPSTPAAKESASTVNETRGTVQRRRKSADPKNFDWKGWSGN